MAAPFLSVVEPLMEGVANGVQESAAVTQGMAATSLSPMAVSSLREVSMLQESAAVSGATEEM